MNCKFCGKKISNNHNYCGNCGKAIKKNTSFSIIILIPLFITIILCYLSIPLIKDAFFVEHEGLEGLSVLGDVGILTYGYIFLSIIWAIYLDSLSKKMKSNNNKNWKKPRTIIILIIIFPYIILSIPIIFDTIKSTLYDYRKTSPYTTPEIKHYENLNDIPVYNDYKILGEDIDEYDVYNNFEKYKDIKVLVKGRPSHRGVNGTNENIETVSISNKNTTDILLYMFNFIDNSSEFYNDDYAFFTTENTSLYDYYAYIYGTISTVNNINYYKVIIIKPEKIYYIQN